MRRSASLRSVQVFAAWLLLAVLNATAAAQTRIVAIGDVHGALPEFESILKETGLVDAKRGTAGGWTGGNTLFIQLGDVVDRGPQTRACLDLLMSLERSARKGEKGKVIALLGNHEVMAMTGDTRYVSPEDFRSFATAKSEGLRQTAYREYLSFLADRARAGVLPAHSISSEEWMAQHPAGFFERRDAFGPQGVYGRWLRQHGIAYQSDGVVFVHGGLSPNISFDNIDDLNRQMRGALAAFDRGWDSLVKAGIIWRYMALDEAIVEIQRERAAIPMRDVEDIQRREELEKFIDLVTWLVSTDHPTWYRGLAQQPEQTLGPSVQGMMARLKIDAIVVGHTVTPGFEIRQRFDNHVFLIDTGMLSSVFGGKASALEIRDRRFIAHSVGQPPRILTSPGDSRISPSAGQRTSQP